MTAKNASELLKCLDVNPLFLLNMIGRPDYWAPQAHWEADDDGSLLACGRESDPMIYDILLTYIEIYFVNTLAGTSNF